MFIIGLTGGIATGKSTVLDIFRSHGVAVVDADQIARKVIEPGTAGWHKLKLAFSDDDIFFENGEVNRTRLGEVVFNDVDKRKKLNQITHPLIQQAMIKVAFRHLLNGEPYIVMELPLLFESGRMINFMHKIITVVCDDAQQLERLMIRNGYTEQTAQKRIVSQMPLQYKADHSNFVIYNDGTFEETKNHTEQIIKYLKSLNFHWYIRSVAIVGCLCIGFVCAYIMYILRNWYLSS